MEKIELNFDEIDVSASTEKGFENRASLLIKTEVAEYEIKLSKQNIDWLRGALKAAKNLRNYK